MEISKKVFSYNIELYVNGYNMITIPTAKNDAI